MDLFPDNSIGLPNQRLVPCWTLQHRTTHMPVSPRFIISLEKCAEYFISFASKLSSAVCSPSCIHCQLYDGSNNIRFTPCQGDNPLSTSWFSTVLQVCMLWLVYTKYEVAFTQKYVSRASSVRYIESAGLRLSMVFFSSFISTSLWSRSRPRTPPVSSQHVVFGELASFDDERSLFRFRGFSWLCQVILAHITVLQKSLVSSALLDISGKNGSHRHRAWWSLASLGKPEQLLENQKCFPKGGYTPVEVFNLSISDYPPRSSYRRPILHRYSKGKNSNRSST